MITTILIIFGLAVLAVEIAYHSSLAYELKKFLWLTEDKQKRLLTLSSGKLWKTWLPKWLWWFIPIPVILFAVFSELNQWFNCPYCQSAWYGFGAGILLGHPIILCVGLAGICIYFVYIVEITAKELHN